MYRLILCFFRWKNMLWRYKSEIEETLKICFKKLIMWKRICLCYLWNDSTNSLQFWIQVFKNVHNITFFLTFLILTSISCLNNFHVDNASASIAALSVSSCLLFSLAFKILFCAIAPTNSRGSLEKNTNYCNFSNLGAHYH